MKRIISIKNFISQVYKIWVSERPATMAAALAYYGMFSFAPAIFIAVTVAGFFINQAALIEQITSKIETVLGAEIAQTIVDILTQLSTDKYQSDQFVWLASIIGFLALLWAASGLFFQMQFALNTVWQVPLITNNGTRRYIRQRLFSLLIVILLGVILVISFMANVFLKYLRGYIGIIGEYQISGWVIFIGVIFLSLALIYRFIPETEVKWKDVWLGAILTAILEFIAVLVIGFLLNIGALNSPFAAAGSVAIFLIGFNYASQIFLLGAVISRVYSETYGSRRINETNQTNPE
jgi:membrane protein